MTRLDVFWASNSSWYHWEGGKMILNNNAPPEAVESYNNYQRQVIEHYNKVESLSSYDDE